MKNKLAALSFVATLLVAATPANASLIGASLDGSFTPSGGSSINQFASPAIVGPGSEFSGSYTDVFEQIWDIDVDFGDASMTVGFTERTRAGGGNIYSGGPVLSLSFSGSPDLGSLAFQSYACTSPSYSCGTFGGGPNISSFGYAGGVLTFGFNALRSGETYVFAGRPTAVSEPATLALFGLGMLGIFFGRRRSA